MTATPRPSNLAPLLHLGTGAALGVGLVWVVLLNSGSAPMPEIAGRVKRTFPGLVLDSALFGAVGGFLGGFAAGSKAKHGYAPGIRHWMVALGGGVALTLGAVALRNAPAIPTSDGGGPAAHVLVWLVVGWLAGVLLGAVGSAFAQAASPGLAPILRKVPGQALASAWVVGGLVGALAWALFWAALVAGLALLGLAIVLLSFQTGGEGPALAVGGSCGCIFFGLRYVMLVARNARM